jgi:hypothetical protein
VPPVALQQLVEHAVGEEGHPAGGAHSSRPVRHHKSRTKSFVAEMFVARGLRRKNNLKPSEKNPLAQMPPPITLPGALAAERADEASDGLDRRTPASSESDDCESVRLGDSLSHYGTTAHCWQLTDGMPGILRTAGTDSTVSERLNPASARR